MDNWGLDEDLHDAAERVIALSRRAIPGVEHKAALRADLIRRHGDLYGPGRPRGSTALMRRWLSTRRFSVVAPLAASAALACMVVVGALQISGRQAPQSADAARITTRLIASAPTVTGWQWTLRQTRNGVPAVQRRGAPLRPYQRLYIRDGRSYLYSYGKWFLVVPQQGTGPAAFSWQWAIAAIADRLAQRKFTHVPDKVIAGQLTYGIQYVVDKGAGDRVTVSAWLDRHSGLVSRLAASFWSHGKVVESDIADYTYVRTP